MKKRNLLLLVVTFLLAFAFFNIVSSKTVNAKSTGNYIKGYPAQFKGVWVGKIAYADETDKKMVYLRQLFVMEGKKPYFHDVYYDKNGKFTESFNSKMYFPAYLWLSKDKFSFGFTPMSNKKAADVALIHLVDYNHITFKFSMMDDKKEESNIIPFQRYPSVQQALKTLKANQS